ncbi:MAG: flagellar brake domain-containing protein [Lachnospiraceae bacterium]|nr:flagellar brake domain-containing protein [Lachnospiraceae bacterium]
MDFRINIGDKLDLKKIEKRLSVDPDREVPVYITQVLDETAEGDILVAMPVSEGRVIPLNVDDEYDTTFYTKSGLLNCRTLVRGRYKKDALFLLALQQLTDLKKIQRREYFRLSCRNPLTYRILDDKEREEVEHGWPSTAKVEDDAWKNGIMLDLSGGGIRFVSASREEPNSMIQVRFEYILEDDPRVMYAYANLLRSERNENNTGIYDQRIKFFRMDRNLREELIRYIFETQRKLRSKESGMQ